MIDSSNPSIEPVEIVRSPSARLIKELSLVLHAIGIQHGNAQGPGYQSILVGPEDAGRAMEELANYQRENHAWPPPKVRIEPVSGGTWSAVVYASVLAILFRLQQVGAFGIDWGAAGRIDGPLVRAGEWWRGVTALTLHADLMHLVSNLVFGAVFGVLVCQVHGPAIAWLGIVLAGALGNLINTAAHGFDNYSLGASTAVFAALGTLGATQWVRKLRLGSGLLASWGPLFAAAMLLGWHGMGSARFEPGRGIVRDPNDHTDIGAHLFGFLTGIVVGALLAQRRLKGPERDSVRKLAGAATLALLAGAWAIALLRAG